MLRTILMLACLSFGVSVGFSSAAPSWPGYVDSGFQNEQAREIRFAEDCRAIILAPPAEEFESKKPTLLIVYATPNGNTAEQTLGCALAEGRDWHFDIQHAAAQWRTFRELESQRNVVFACVQANNLSWPTWKEQHTHGPQYIRQIVESLAASLPSENVNVVLTGHSGGGEFSLWLHRRGGRNSRPG
jgi:poly(3-hydroxybutyrate) depolymerase